MKSAAFSILALALAGVTVVDSATTHANGPTVPVALAPSNDTAAPPVPVSWKDDAMLPKIPISGIQRKALRFGPFIVPGSNVSN